MKDRRVRAVAEVAVLDADLAELGDDRGLERGVRIGLEVGVHEERHLRLQPVELDERGVVDIAGDLSGGALVDAKQGRQLADVVGVDIERFGRELAEPAALQAALMASRSAIE